MGDKENKTVKVNRVSLEQLTSAFNNVYFSSFYADLVNDTFECLSTKEHIINITGKTGIATEALHMTSMMLATPDYREGLLEFVKFETISARLKENPSIFHEFLGTVSGWCRAGFIAANYDDAGNVTGAIYTIQMIDADKRMELDRQRELEKQLSIAKSLSDIYNSAHYLSLADNTFIELSSNPQIVEILGHEGKATFALQMVVDKFTAEEEKAALAEFNRFDTIALRLKYTDAIYHEFRGVLHGWTRAGFIAARRDENGNVTHAIYTTQTIDAEKQREFKMIEDLRNAVDLANNATKAKSDFLSHMSHEIRTPINAVLGMNEMIIRESKEENILEYAANVQEAGNALLAIINDVLDFSKIESGKMEIVSGEYELYSLINDCYHMVENRARNKGLKFVINCDETIPAVYKGDMHRIRQVCINFLTNAIKYTDEGSVSFDISKTDYNGETALKFVVSDTGTGISEKNLKKLFVQFERFDLSRNQSVEGTGLGLAITKNIVELMDGRLLVESELNKGSVFTAIIPQEVVDERPIGKISYTHSTKEIMEKQKSNHFEAPFASVLVVDDVAMNIKVFSKLLSLSKMSIDAALSGQDALTKTSEKKYDLIFMDHMMPGMDGLETTDRIKKQENGLNRETPVIMLSANALGGVKEQYLSMGFADYISKPVKTEKLEDILRKFLEK